MIQKRYIVRNPALTNQPAAVATKPRGFGLGDAVALIAQPVAKVVDKLAGSKIATCSPCSQRRQRLNSLVPDLSHPFRK